MLSITSSCYLGVWEVEGRNYASNIIKYWSVTNSLHTVSLVGLVLLLSTPRPLNFTPFFHQYGIWRGKPGSSLTADFFLSTASAGIVVSQRKVRQISDPIQQILIQLHKVIYITQVSVPAFYFFFILSTSLVLILPKNSFEKPLESTPVHVLWVATNME